MEDWTLEQVQFQSLPANRFLSQEWKEKQIQKFYSLFLSYEYQTKFGVLMPIIHETGS